MMLDHKSHRIISESISAGDLSSITLLARGELAS